MSRSHIYRHTTQGRRPTENAESASRPHDHPLLWLQRAVGNRTVQRLCGDELAASRGQPLDNVARAEMESRLGADLGNVRVHIDARAADAADAIGADAFTAGQDIYFGAGRYLTDSAHGQRLLAHELVHTVQDPRGAEARADRHAPLEISAPDDGFERAANHAVDRMAAGGAATQAREAIAPDGVLARQPKPSGGDKDGDKKKGSSFKRITMKFDGNNLTVFGDDTEVFKFTAQSGRPILITEKDATECKANQVTETYMNNPKFVGIRDAGPTPEGTYTISPKGIQHFTSKEESDLLWGGIWGKHTVNVQGAGIHPGDWGSGRVSLNPASRLRQGPCGVDPNKRDGFFLHGGILAGSSGCLDIGSHFDELAEFLESFGRAVTLTVEYTQPAPSVGFVTGLSGAVAYRKGGDFEHRFGLTVGPEFGPGGTRTGIVSPSYDLVYAWAGGALNAGVKLDIPFDSRDSFVRAAVGGGASFRIFGPLFGRLYGGGSHALSGPEGWRGEVSGGLSLDLGRVQFEALYDVLSPASQDERIQRALVGIGFRFGRK